jgi:hypothetical protein
MPTQKAGLIIVLGTFVAIVALVVIGLHHATPPASLPASISAAEFSSGRALPHVRHIAQQPHPTGTMENAAVRDYLLAQLQALGLQPEVQNAFAVNASGPWGNVGNIHNVLVRIPGRTAGKALLLMAHYDSTPTGPGAADDAASVAAILETLRALQAQPALQNDVFCLFSDGEEAGLLGASAFVAEHPWTPRVGLVLNFEYRGNSGPFLMFETSPGNGKLIDGFAKAAPHPIGNSLMYEVYKRLPNDTDLSVFKRVGIPGMNFAAIEGHSSYHTHLDRAELLQEASLQHQGETLLALTQFFGNVPLDDLCAADRVYFDAPGLGLISYPVRWVMSLCVATLLLFIAILVLGLKSGALRMSRTALAAGEFLLMVALLAGGCQLLWLGIRSIHPEYDLLLQGDTYNSHWYLLSFVMLAVGLFALIQSQRRKHIRPMEAAAGAMACWLLALIITGIAWPGASSMFLWPLLPMLLAVATALWLRCRNAQSSSDNVIFLLGATPGILLFAPLIKMLFIALTPQQCGVAIAALAMLLGLLVPLLDMLLCRPILPWLPPALGMVFLVLGSFTAVFDVEHPRPDNLFYALDGASGKALWLSANNTLAPWTERFFPAPVARRQVPEIFGEDSRLYWTAPAPAFAVQAPVIEVREDSVASGIRKIGIRIKSLRQAPEIRVAVEGGVVLDAKVQGRIFSQTPRQAWRVKSFGVDKEGLAIELRVPTGVPFIIRATDISYVLPQANMQPRPAGTIAQPFGLSDTSLAVTIKVLP